MNNQNFLNLSSHFKGAIIDQEIWKNLIGGGGSFTKITTNDHHSLREWWYEILRNHGKYPCYAIFLLLPSDKELINFLEDSSDELHVISDKHCLIIVLGRDYFYTVGLNNEYWIEANTSHITNGESLQVAELFGIELTQFPSLLFFDDIRSSEFAIISFKNLKKKEISEILRETFAIIRQQKNSTSIIEAIQEYSKTQKTRQIQNSSYQVATAFINKTIETIIEVWIKANIK